MSKIRLNSSDIKNIVEILSKFTNVDSFELHEHSQSGIGSCLDMVFESEVNDIKCKIVVPIADESSW